MKVAPQHNGNQNRNVLQGFGSVCILEAKSTINYLTFRLYPYKRPDLENGSTKSNIFGFLGHE